MPQTPKKKKFLLLVEEAEGGWSVSDTSGGNPAFCGIETAVGSTLKSCLGHLATNVQNPVRLASEVEQVKADHVYNPPDLAVATEPGGPGYGTKTEPEPESQ